MRRELDETELKKESRPEARLTLLPILNQFPRDILARYSRTEESIEETYPENRKRSQREKPAKIALANGGS